MNARARAFRYNTARARQCPLSLSVLSTRVQQFSTPRHRRSIRSFLLPRALATRRATTALVTLERSRCVSRLACISLLANTPSFRETRSVGSRDRGPEVQIWRGGAQVSQSAGAKTCDTRNGTQNHRNETNTARHGTQATKACARDHSTSLAIASLSLSLSLSSLSRRCRPPLAIVSRRVGDRPASTFPPSFRRVLSVASVAR